MALADYIMGAPVATALPQKPSGTSQVLSSLDQITNSNSSYMENARRRGLEVAGSRGGINSSIAAGASQRAALEAAQPLLDQSLNIDQQYQSADISNWMANQDYARGMSQFYSQNQYHNLTGMLGMINQMQLQDPELYTPEVASGYLNFFQKMMGDALGRYGI